MLPNVLVLPGDIGSVCTIDLGNECGWNPMNKSIKVRVESVDVVDLLLAIFRCEISEDHEHFLITSLSPLPDSDGD